MKTRGKIAALLATSTILVLTIQDIRTSSALKQRRALTIRGSESLVTTVNDKPDTEIHDPRSFTVFNGIEYFSEPTTEASGTDKPDAPTPASAIQAAIQHPKLEAWEISARNQEVILNWSTASEKGLSAFHVKRKSLGEDWQVVAYLGSSWGSTAIQYYEFSDGKLAAGIYAYRLKCLAHDGTFEYSDVRYFEVFE